MRDTIILSSEKTVTPFASDYWTSAHLMPPPFRARLIRHLVEVTSLVHGRGLWLSSLEFFERKQPCFSTTSTTINQPISVISGAERDLFEWKACEKCIRFRDFCSNSQIFARTWSNSDKSVIRCSRCVSGCNGSSTEDITNHESVGSSHPWRWISPRNQAREWLSAKSITLRITIPTSTTRCRGSTVSSDFPVTNQENYEWTG